MQADIVTRDTHVEGMPGSKRCSKSMLKTEPADIKGAGLASSKMWRMGMFWRSIKVDEQVKIKKGIRRCFQALLFLIQSIAVPDIGPSITKRIKVRTLCQPCLPAAPGSCGEAFAVFHRNMIFRICECPLMKSFGLCATISFWFPVIPGG